MGWTLVDELRFPGGFEIKMKIVMCIIFSCAKAAYLSLHMVEVRQIGHRTYERRDGGDRLARRVCYAHVDGGISHRRSDCNDSMTANSRARLCLVCAALIQSTRRQARDFVRHAPWRS